MFLPKSFLFLLLVIGSLLTEAQEALNKFRHIRVADGLIHNTVNCMLEDEKGFVWIGTNNGLQRYDGQDFLNFQKSEGDIGLQSSIIRTLFKDRDARMWIGTTDGGITVFSPDDNTYSTLTSSNSKLKSDDIYCIDQDSLGRVWVGTALGIELFNENNLLITDSLNRDELPSALFETGIRSFFKDSDGNLLVGSELGDLINLKINKENYALLGEDLVSDNIDTDDLPSTAILDIAKDSTGAYWLATWNGLVSLQPRKHKAKRFFKHELNLPGQIVSSLEYTQDHKLYIGTWGSGLIAFDLNTNKKKEWVFDPSNPDGLSFNDISCLMTTRDGNLWIGTNWGGGVNILRPDVSHFKHYKIENVTNGNDNNIVQAFVEDNNDNLYIGTRSGLFKGSPEKGYEMLHVEGMPDGMINYPIRSLAFDSVRNSLWVGTDGYGLLHYNLSSHEVKWYRLCWSCHSSISNNSIWDIKIDKEGMVWLASWGGGIDRLDPDAGLFKNFPIDPKNFGQNVALSLDFDSDGMIWAATYGKGIARLDPNTGVFSFMLSSSKGNYKANGMYYHIFVASDNTVWAASLSGGLIKINLKAESIKIFNRSNTNIDNVIIAINEDENHNIWACSEQSLCRIDPYSRIECFSKENGIPESSFSIGATYFTHDGKLLFGNSDGFICFQPNDIKSVRPYLNAEITEISLFDKPIIPHKNYKGNVILKSSPENTERIVLSHFQNSLSFTFTAFDYLSADRNNFGYKLEGFDEDWRYTDAASRKAVYTNLPSGHYRLLVSASPNGARWNTKLRSLEVIVKKAYWEQWWFYVVCFAVFAVVVALVVRGYTLSLKLKNRWLQNEIDSHTEKITTQNKELAIKNHELHAKSKKINEYFQEVLAQKEEIKNQRDFLQTQNEDIKSSIDYAKLIQDATLPSKKYFGRLFKKSFLIYWPRDVVSGDFFWVSETKLSKVLVVADCTGHGVPGAFMSMLGISLLNEILNQGEIVHAGAVLDELRYKIIHSLNKQDAKTVAKDGMDMAICVFEKGGGKMNFAGANSNMLYLKESGELITVKSDRMPVGYHDSRSHAFTNHQIELEKGDRFYLMSDGWADQFGGPKGKKFKTAQIRQTIKDLKPVPIADNKKYIEDKLSDWMKNSINGTYESQLDDVIIAGIEIDEDLL